MAAKLREKLSPEFMPKKMKKKEQKTSWWKKLFSKQDPPLPPIPPTETVVNEDEDKLWGHLAEGIHIFTLGIHKLPLSSGKYS